MAMSLALALGLGPSAAYAAAMGVTPKLTLPLNASWGSGPTLEPDAGTNITTNISPLLRGQGNYKSVSRAQRAVLGKSKGMKKRALVALYGVQNRALGCAFNNTHHNLRLPLIEMGYSVDVYVLEVIGLTNMDSVPFVFGTLLNEATIYKNVSVEQVDAHTKHFCQSASCKYRPDYDKYPGLVQRALRQLWLESEIANFVRANANSYDIAVAMESSIWLPFSITRADVDTVLSSKTVLRSDNNDAGGYTNGLLLGAPSPLAATMSRFRRIFFPEPDDYEHQLKRAFEAAGVSSAVLANSRGRGRFKSLAKLRHSGKTWGVAVDPGTRICLHEARFKTAERGEATHVKDRTLYLNGYASTFLQNFAETLFPEYGKAIHFFSGAKSTSVDIMVVGLYGPMKGTMSTFVGTVVYLNGESTNAQTSKQTRSLLLGPSNQRNSMPFYYASFAALGAYFKSAGLHTLTTPRQLTPKRYFLSYKSSHCIPIREAAYDAIVETTTARSLAEGSCHGRHPETRKPENVTKVWTENSAPGNARFVLTMENTKVSGYITEKIVNGFLAGSVPIYWGTLEVFKLFNKKAFVYYDESNPEPALKHILYLERNRTAYAEVLAQPILATGALEKYFSLRDDVGGGKLKQRIRDMVFGSGTHAPAP